MGKEVLEKVKTQAAELQKTIKEAAKKSVLKEFFLEFFAKAPEVEAIQWTQYTPYFNDGEPCTFGIRDPTFKITGREYGEDDYEWDCSWTLEKGEVPKTTLKAIKEFSSEFSELSDVFELAFGDGFKIIVTRDGKIEVEEYDHD